MALGDQDEGYTTLLALGVHVGGGGESKKDLSVYGRQIPGSKGYLRPVLVADCGFSQELYRKTTPSRVPGHLTVFWEPSGAMTIVVSAMPLG